MTIFNAEPETEKQEFFVNLFTPFQGTYYVDCFNILENLPLGLVCWRTPCASSLSSLTGLENALLIREKFAFWIGE